MTEYSNVYRTKYSNLAKTPQKGSAEYGQVEKDAAQEFQDRLKAIDMRIKQTQALRDADMSGIRRNQDMAQRDINDQMFREYLANRERMGGRGVANSGLMADAQIRLNANKQDRMAELYGQTQDKLSEANRMYAPQQTELLGERANTRQSKIFKEMFDKLLDNRSRELQGLAPLMQNEFTDEQRLKKEIFDKAQAEEERAARAKEAELERQARAEAAKKADEAAAARLKLELDARAKSDQIAAATAAADRAAELELKKLEKAGATNAAKLEFYIGAAERHKANADRYLEDMREAQAAGDWQTYSDYKNRHDKARAAEQAAVKIAKKFLPK
jgi:hypothetical protein